MYAQFYLSFTLPFQYVPISNATAFRFDFTSNSYGVNYLCGFYAASAAQPYAPWKSKKAAAQLSMDSSMKQLIQLLKSSPEIADPLLQMSHILKSNK